MAQQIPGFLPPTQPKLDSRLHANDDGSIEFAVFSQPVDETRPFIHTRVLTAEGDGLYYDEDNETISFREVGTTRTAYVVFEAGLLPKGLLQISVKIQEVHGDIEYEEYLVEVPDSPFHVDSVFDIAGTKGTAISSALNLRGPAGPIGPAGPNGADPPSYTHTQAIASTSWVIEHNLGVYLKVTVLVGGAEVEADITYDSLNQVTVTFSEAVTGTAFLR